MFKDAGSGEDHDTRQPVGGVVDGPDCLCVLQWRLQGSGMSLFLSSLGILSNCPKTEMQLGHFGNVLKEKGEMRLLIDFVNDLNFVIFYRVVFFCNMIVIFLFFF